MTIISDLPEDLIGNILSKVPLVLLKALRSTCKTFNSLSKNHIVGNKATTRKQYLEFMVIDSKVCSLRFDLQGIRDDDNIFVEPSVKQVSILNQVEISQVFHCDGLLLCVPKDHPDGLVVWNPYLGETRWIQPTRNKFHSVHCYAFGYDTNRNYKILKFFYDHENKVHGRAIMRIDVYDFSSSSWRIRDIDPDVMDGLGIFFYPSDVSLKGNTYFYGKDIKDKWFMDIKDYLVCFDFTTERFGPRLLLPFRYFFNDAVFVSLSWVRDEKLAVLYSHCHGSWMIEIWVTTKIEPNEVSWSKFLTIDTTILVTSLPNDFSVWPEDSFFIDEEKKVMVLFGRDDMNNAKKRITYIIGEDGYLKYANIGEALNTLEVCTLVCSSYVPSLVNVVQFENMKESDD